MFTNQVILSPISLEELTSKLTESLKQEIEKHFIADSQKQDVAILTRKEAAKLLNISLPTLNQWTKEGTILGYRIASRIRYKRSELESALKSIKTTSK